MLTRNGFQLVLAIAVIPAAVHAAEVQVQVSSRKVMLAEPLTLRLAVVNAREHDPPTLPKMTDFDVLGQPQRSESSQTRIVGGRRTFTVTVTYQFSLLAKRLGKLTIPGFVVKADGMNHRVEPIEIEVVKNDSGDLLIVELASNKTEAFVEEPIEVSLKIWLLPFKYGGRPLSEQDMWSSIDHRSSRWGAFGEKITAGKVRARKAYRTGEDGKSKLYYLYQCTETVWPDKAGRLETEPIQVAVTYPVRLRRSVFGDLSMTQSRKLVSTPAVREVIVKPIPLVGRPEDYQDAVGQFEIQVTAQPTEFRVGDPITLNIEITGTGRMQFIKPPNLALVKSLIADFKVHEETLPGQIEGELKRFSQSVRAENSSVETIPPIPFCYFDPEQAAFVTIHSEAIPIQVEAGEQVDAMDVVAVAGAAKTRLLTEVGPGLMANYSDPNALLASQAFVLSWPWYLVLGAGPMAYVWTWVLTRRHRRFREDVGLGRRRHAAKNAKKTLKRGRQQSNSAERAATAANVLLGYIADRLDLPSGGFTRPDAVRQLQQCHADARLIADTDDILSRCEAARFAGGHSQGTDRVLDEAWQCIHEMEKAKWG